MPKNEDAPIWPIRAYRWVMFRYFEFWRSLTPDWLYKLWYRTGVMDTESYREWQRRGHISDDIDPEYLQRDGQR